MRPSRFLLAVMLGCWMTSGMAISLGRSQGAVFVGRALDISIQAVLDGTENSATSCLAAEVFYADSRVESSRVRISLAKAGPGREALIRVRTSAVVDEPVVTVLVRAGCGSPMERRYVLLADLAPQQASAVAGSPPVLSPERDALLPLPVGAPPVSAVVKPGPSTSRLRQQVRRDADPAAPLPARSVIRVPGKPAARLTLEPLDLLLELPPQLKASRELLSLPTVSIEQRAMAAAMWKALTAEPGDVLRDAEKMNAMASDLLRLSAETRVHREALVALKGQMQQQDVARAWVYAGIAVLSLALLIAAYVLRWRRAALRMDEPDGPWWRSKKPGEGKWFARDTGAYANDRADSIPVDSDLLYLAPQERQESAPRQGDAPLPPARRATAGPLSPVSRRDRMDFALSMPHTPRPVKAEELFDVQHQAEFFISIGKPEQAVAVLRSHVSEEVQTSALVYLDLFSLYHQLKRREDFEALRVEFNRLFNADLPAFESYSGTGPGLEAYQAALSRIVALWPTPKVLEVIEESVFRKPGSRAEAFGLEAYRELLFLYGIAKEIVHSQPAAGESLLDFDLPSLPDADPTGLAQRRVPAELAGRTAIQPLSAASGGEREAAFPSLRADTALDIDLGTLEADRPHLTAGFPAGLAPPLKTAVPAALTDAFGDFNLIDFEVSGSSGSPAAVRPAKM
ncbi:MAG: hypothetical protein PSV26_17630 [Polaromonas sp.]|uniref:hypothetical protein n=1 Tax=Polaromonas sp. TaxID=1869339 RepID=UPI002487A47D|nr:hypothetical protein [Polaromonas sp.]MDI1239306.1 hypothetical protein [Polaromonas sp.]